jgi:hypothetical protein
MHTYLSKHWKTQIPSNKYCKTYAATLPHKETMKHYQEKSNRGIYAYGLEDECYKYVNFP